MLPDGRIALIEAGGERLGLTTKVPGTAFVASSFRWRNWNFKPEPVPALNGRRLSWFQGVCFMSCSRAIGFLRPGLHLNQIVSFSGSSSDLRQAHRFHPLHAARALGVRRWQWPTVDVVLVPIMTVDLAPFGANALKIPSGGWFP
jgi:hypothetical protein